MLFDFIYMIIDFLMMVGSKIKSFFTGVCDFFSKKVTVSTGVLTALYTFFVSASTLIVPLLIKNKYLGKLFKNKKGEAYVDTGVKILIAVVIGALLLALLYALFNDTIMPSVTEKVEELFNYAG